MEKKAPVDRIWLEWQDYKDLQYRTEAKYGNEAGNTKHDLKDKLAFLEKIEALYKPQNNDERVSLNFIKRVRKNTENELYPPATKLYPGKKDKVTFRSIANDLMIIGRNISRSYRYNKVREAQLKNDAVHLGDLKMRFSDAGYHSLSKQFEKDFSHGITPGRKRFEWSLNEVKRLAFDFVFQRDDHSRVVPTSYDVDLIDSKNPDRSSSQNFKVAEVGILPPDVAYNAMSGRPFVVSYPGNLDKNHWMTLDQGEFKHLEPSRDVSQLIRDLNVQEAGTTEGLRRLSTAFQKGQIVEATQHNGEKAYMMLSNDLTSIRTFGSDFQPTKFKSLDDHLGEKKEQLQQMRAGLSVAYKSPELSQSSSLEV